MNAPREWWIGRAEGGWHWIYDTNSIICARVFGAGRARVVVSALAAVDDEPILAQSDDDIADPMFTEAVRGG